MFVNNILFVLYLSVKMSPWIVLYRSIHHQKIIEKEGPSQTFT